MDDFERAVKQAARQLRRMPKELKSEMARHVQTEVAGPLAEDIASAARGATPWGAKIAPVVKARVQGDPTIAIGANRSVFSGGASVNQVFYGANFGGGRRRRATQQSSRGKSFTRRSTSQFIRKSSEFVYSTLERRKAWGLEQWVKVIDPFIERWERGA